MAIIIVGSEWSNELISQLCVFFLLCLYSPFGTVKIL